MHDDILINVTSVFRDPDAFTALRRAVFPELVKGRSGPDDPVRVWVPGCSSGEEVYSLAITSVEFYEQAGTTIPTQLFGTDVSETAIERARAGVYSARQVAEVSPERLRRFFRCTERGTYQVTKAVRDLCVFARQDMVRDPPFSRIDLISCRNVLIYLGQGLQRRVLPLFHYALKPHGFLLLGSSESVGAFSRLFALVDKPQRIYQKEAGVPPVRLDPFPARALRRAAGERPRVDNAGTPAPFDASREADRVLLTHYVPAAIVVDALGEIVHVRGECGPYLRPAPGKPSLHVLRMVRADEEDLELARVREELGASRAYSQAIVEKYDAVTEDLRSAHEEVLIFQRGAPVHQRGAGDGQGGAAGHQRGALHGQRRAAPAERRAGAAQRRSREPLREREHPHRAGGREPAVTTDHPDGRAPVQRAPNRPASAHHGLQTQLRRREPRSRAVAPSRGRVPRVGRQGDPGPPRALVLPPHAPLSVRG